MFIASTVSKSLVKRHFLKSISQIVNKQFLDVDLECAEKFKDFKD